MKKQRGFTLLEIFITLTIGLVLFAGVLSVFVGMKSTVKVTSSYGGMQETGRFAISVLTDDLMRQGFWGDMVMPMTRSNLLGVPAVAPVGECIGEGINNRTFPLALGHYRTIWGRVVTAANNMSCITDAKIGSDILQLKRAISSEETGALNANRYYLVTNLTTGQIIDGGTAVPTINNSKNWEFQHHVYYVSEQTVGSNKIPTLNLISLANTMSNQPLIDGVEQIKFMYGVDSNLNGVVNAFISANNMTQAFWDNENNSRIIAVKMYVLVRDILPDNSYTNSTTYQLGDTTFTAPGDNYRRMLFSSTVTLHNGDVEIW